jgi:hypothetical protein
VRERLHSRSNEPLGQSTRCETHSDFPRDGRTEACSSKDVEPQHPPDEEQRNDGHHHVANPLADGPRLGSIGHSGILASCGTAGRLGGHDPLYKTRRRDIENNYELRMLL